VTLDRPQNAVISQRNQFGGNLSFIVEILLFQNNKEFVKIA